jgi:hypothetical protein
VKPAPDPAFNKNPCFGTPVAWGIKIGVITFIYKPNILAFIIISFKKGYKLFYPVSLTRRPVGPMRGYE